MRSPGLDDVQAGLRLADYLLRHGDKSRAAEAYVRVAELYVGRDQPMQAAAICYRGLQIDPDGFPELIGDLPERIMEAASEAGPLRDTLIELLERAGRRHEAAQLLWATVQQLERDGNNAGLLDVGPRVLDLDPEHVLGRRALARAYLRVGELGACLETVNALAKGDDEIGLEVLARVQVECGRNDAALQALHRLAATLSSRDQREQADRVLARAARWADDDSEYRETVAGLRNLLAADEPVSCPALIDEALSGDMVELTVEATG